MKTTIIAFFITLNCFAQDILNNKYIPVIKNVAKAVEINPNLVISVAWTESHFKPSARSHVGASGIMQIMPQTRVHLLKSYLDDNFKRIYTSNLGQIRGSDLEDIILASLYLKELKNEFKSQKISIIAYNAGPSRVRRLLSKPNFGQNHDYYKKVSSKMELLASN
jgi:soluble lytic murein transglycosylase-like protein